MILHHERLGRAVGPGKLAKLQRGAGVPRWVLAYTDARGKRHRVALSTDKRVAERMTNEIIRQRDLELAGLGAVEGMSMPLVDLRDAYLGDLETRVGKSQFVNVKLRLRMILEGLGVERVRDLRVIDVLKYRAERLKAGVANRTANADVGAIKAMLRWGVDAQLIHESPLRGIRRLPMGEAHQKRPRRAMTDKEIAAFLAAAEEDDERASTTVLRRRPRADVVRTFHVVAYDAKRVRIPQAPFWSFLLTYGARYGETRTLAWGDVDLERCTVSLRPENTKTGRARCVPISRDFAAELVQLRALHARALGRPVRAGDRVFLSPEGQPHREDTTNCRRVYRRILEAAGIERVDALGRRLDVHALRGTAATSLARRGVSMAVTQRLLGHQTIAMTARHYTRLDVEDVRAAVERGGGHQDPERARGAGIAEGSDGSRSLTRSARRRDPEGEARGAAGRDAADPRAQRPEAHGAGVHAPRRRGDAGGGGGCRKLSVLERDVEREPPFGDQFRSGRRSSNHQINSGRVATTTAMIANTATTARRITDKSFPCM